MNLIVLSQNLSHNVVLFSAKLQLKKQQTKYLK